MPSLVTNMGAPIPKIVATEKENAKIKITALFLDARTALGDRTIQLIDRFTPSISNGNPAPGIGEQTRDRLRISMAAGAGQVWNFDEEELKNVECLGAPELNISIADAGFWVTIAWELV